MKGHIRAGEPTYFVEKVQGCLYNMGVDLSDQIKHPETHMSNNMWHQCPKHHTIRMGRHFKANDELTLAAWSGKPYRSKQVKLWTGPIRAVDIVIQINRLYNSMKVCKVVRFSNGPGIHITLDSINKVELAKNDGLSLQDFEAWFNLPFGDHEAQILIWNPEIYY
jgi:hypothetical protein